MFDVSDFEERIDQNVGKQSDIKIENVEAYDPQAEEFEKRKQMAEIYGDKNWEEVLRAETSLQVNFNRFCDKELPQIWPCLPLNLKFD